MSTSSQKSSSQSNILNLLIKKQDEMKETKESNIIVNFDDECQLFKNKPSRNPITNKKFDFYDEKVKEVFNDYVNKCKLLSERSDIIANNILKDDVICNYYLNTDKNIFEGSDYKLFDNNFFNNTCGFKNKRKNFDYSKMQILHKVFELKDFQTLKTPLYFTDNYKNIDEWIKAQEIYLRLLTEDDIKLVKFYQSVGMYEWNRILRGEISPCDNILGKSPDKIYEEFVRFYNIIINAPRTPDMYVWRGEKYDEFETFNNSYDKDSHIYKRGFTSTTLNISEAFFHASNEYNSDKDTFEVIKDKNKHLFKIHLPIGTPALLVSLRVFDDNKPAYFSHSLEIALPPNIMRNVGNIQLDENNKKALKLIDYNINTYDVKRYTQLEFIATLPLKYFPRGRVPQEFIIEEFLKYLNKTNDLDTQKNNNNLWILQGGFGIKILLENKYKALNLTPSFDLDIVVTNKLGNSNFDIKNITGNVTKILKDFKFLMKNNNINIYFNKEKRGNNNLIKVYYSLCGNKEYDVSIMDIWISKDYYKYNIDDFIDKDLSKKYGLFIKTQQGYLQELKNYIKEVFIDYDKSDRNLARNPILSDNENYKYKGTKALQRLKVICEVDESGRSDKEFDKICKMIEINDIKSILNIPRNNKLSDSENKQIAAKNLADKLKIALLAK